MPAEIAKTFRLDPDDERDVNAAIAHAQRTWPRWPADDAETPNSLILGEGRSCLAGAILGEICRSWLESQGALRQDGEKQ